MSVIRKPIDNPAFWRQRIIESREMGDLRASVYRTSARDWRLINEQHQQFLEHHIQPNHIVLDAGCGYGRASEFIPGIYIGVDFSRDFIELAKGLYPQKQFSVQNLRDLRGFTENVFDWVVCISIKEMIERELGEDSWLEIKNELLRVSAQGILILEYGNQKGTNCYVIEKD